MLTTMNNIHKHIYYTITILIIHRLHYDLTYGSDIIKTVSKKYIGSYAIRVMKMVTYSSAISLHWAKPAQQ